MMLAQQISHFSIRRSRPMIQPLGDVIIQISLLLPTLVLNFDQLIVRHHRQIASKTWTALRSEKAFESACRSREEREALFVRDHWYSQGVLLASINWEAFEVVGTWGRVSKLLKNVDTRRIRAENECKYISAQRIMQEKYITDVAIDDIKKYQAKQKKNNKKSSLRFPEKKKYNSCTKEMKLHVLVNKVLKRNNWPLRNNFLGQTKIVLVYKMYTHLVSHTGFLIAGRKLNRPPLMESKEPLFSLQESSEMSRQIDVSSLIQPFWPLYRVCIKTYLHTILPLEQINRYD